MLEEYEQLNLPVPHVPSAMDPEIQQTVSEDSEIAVGIFNKLHWHLARESMLL